MPNKTSARTTLKNTGLVGGSKLIGILISIVRGKFVAILLGPTGMGLVQLFQSSITLVKSISGLGIGFSGVKDIAQSVASGDSTKMAKTIVTIKRWSWVTGLLGIIITILLSKKLSYWTFGNENYWIEISILSSTIIMANIAAGYSAIIRGERRMGDFAKIGIFSSATASVFAVLIYYFYGIKGVVPVILITGIINLIINIYYSKKIRLLKVQITYKTSFYEGLDMVKLGVFTVITGFILQLSMYYVRISINDNLDMESVGFYGVATTLAVNYMGLIFGAMGVDYFPKLSAINTDNKAINLAVIEQTKITLLLGTPLVIGMFTLSEYLIRILYTKEFTMALPLLMWMLLSVYLRLIGFPIGYVFLAKGKRKIFIFTQTLWNVIFVTFVYFSWKLRGDLVGIGMAFTLAYAIGVIVNVLILKKLTHLVYDCHTLKLIILFSTITCIYFSISYFYNGGILIFILKLLGLLFLSFYSFKQVEKLIDVNIMALIKSKIVKK